MAYNFKDLPDIATTQPERLIKYRISEDKFSAEVLLPGLWYTDFDKKIGGKVSLCALSKIEESVRSTAFELGLMKKLKNLALGVNDTAFVVVNNVNFSKHFHSITHDTHFGECFPIYALYQVCDVGKTSFSTAVDFYNYRSKEHIASSLTKAVFVDFKTRRPKPISSEFSNELQEFLAKSSSLRQSIKKTCIPQVPANAYVHTLKALYSDCDANNHVNQSVYTRWASDVASTAAKLGKLPSFNHHIELYKVREMKRTFYGEVLVHNEVAVYVWESADTTQCINIVMKQANNLTAVIQMTFFNADPQAVASSLKSVL